MGKTLQVFTIQQASEYLNVSKHTLRFWEKQLGGVILPFRTNGGQRRYTLKHLIIIEEIKRLKRKGLTLTEIRDELQPTRFGEKPDTADPTGIDFLVERISEVVKAAIYNVLEGRSPEKL